MRRPTLRERLLSKVVINWDTGCWEWIGSCDPNGYGKIKVDGMSRVAHRTAYELIEGPIPVGLELDHLCRVRHCINPAHLEPVTPRENVRRSSSPAAANAVKTHCASGHEYDDENTYVLNGHRGCRACHRANQRRYLARKVASGEGSA